MKKLITLIAIVLLQTASFAFDYDLKAICIRPGVSELYVGGEFETILVLNKENGAELRRLDIDFKVLDLQFSKDGSTLIAASNKKVYLLNPESGDIKSELKASGARLFDNSPYFVDVDWLFKKAVTVYSTVDGSPVFTYVPEFLPEDAGFNADFTELIILGRSMDIKSEKKLIQEKLKEGGGYNVYKSAYLKQQDDKKGAGFEVIDMASKKSKLKVVLPYKTARTYGLTISKFANNYYIAGWDVFFKIDEKGNVLPLQTNEATFNYAGGTTPNGKTIFVSSTKNGFVYNCESNQFSAFDARVDDEFSYSKDITADDLVYILNADYTISVLNELGMVKKRLNVSSEKSGKYGIYYTNGYSKKEDRDKEAKIINAQLTALGMPTIDLETGNSDDVLLGLFNSVAEAQNFIAAMDKADLNYSTKVAPEK